MGTALSDYHIKMIKKVTKKIFLFLDNDEPGVQATFKLADKCLRFGLEVKIIRIKNAKDPAEIINKEPDFNIDILQKEAVHPAEFAMQYYKNNFNLNDPENLKNIVNKTCQLINADPITITRGHYLKQLAVISNIELITLQKTLEKFQSTPAPELQQIPPEPQSAPSKPILMLRQNEKRARKSQNILM